MPQYRKSTLKFIQISSKFPASIFQSFFILNFSEYLIDQSADVRVAAIEALPYLMGVVEIELITEHVIPRLSQLVSDTEVIVRLSFAERMPMLVPKMGRKKFNEHFLSLALAMLRDESTEVKSTFIEHFHPIFEVISPISMIESFEPVLAELSSSLVWRNKKVCLDFVVRVAKAGGREALKPPLVRIVIEASKDTFECVRDCFIVTTTRLKELVGEEWCIEHIMKEVEK